MTTKYVKVMVSARRGDRPPYSYVYLTKVRASKAEDAIAKAAWEIAEHENRSRRWKVSIVPTVTSVVVRVGTCQFVVYTLDI